MLVAGGGSGSERGVEQSIVYTWGTFFLRAWCERKCISYSSTPRRRKRMKMRVIMSRMMKMRMRMRMVVVAVAVVKSEFFCGVEFDTLHLHPPIPTETTPF